MDKQGAAGKIIKWKKEVYSKYKKCLGSWEDYRNSIKACQDATRKGKALLELNLAREVKANKKGFSTYINSKRKTRERMGPLLNEVRDMVTDDADMAELLKASFASASAANTCQLAFPNLLV